MARYLYTTNKILRPLSDILRARILSRPDDGRQFQNASQELSGPNSLNITFFVHKHNSLSQRVAQELTAKTHTIRVFEISTPHEMIAVAKQQQPDMIFCPFLTNRVPEEVWSNTSVPCLIVHPGIEGDRGMSSIDWALKKHVDTWGVTVLQAAKEMDAGDIWSTKNFRIWRPNISTLTKSSLYMNEVTNAAVHNCLQAVDNFIDGIAARPLDYSNPRVLGSAKPKMKQADRYLNWADSAEDVARQVRMSDSSPGAVAKFNFRYEAHGCSNEFRAFGAHVEENGLQDMKGVPGTIVGHRDYAILVKCGKGTVWLSHLKRNKLKLPATFWLRNLDVDYLPSPSIELPNGMFPKTFQEIWTNITVEGTCYIHFEFYNGAMSTMQCKRLEQVLATVEEDERVKVIVLMGGFNYYSNGIHLNVIESAEDPSLESWMNINAINDVAQRIFMSKKVTISALRGNAGAGGAMLTLVSDLSFAREGVVLNPHYRTMHLFGSEYHTFFLPQRVGSVKAQEMIDSAAPILSSDALQIGFLDGVFGRTHQEFDDYIDDVVKNVVNLPSLTDIRLKKDDIRNDQWVQNLQKHRLEELESMSKNFNSTEYHMARKAFVYH